VEQRIYVKQQKKEEREKGLLEEDSRQHLKGRRSFSGGSSR
jgi:hypothetical protein